MTAPYDGYANYLENSLELDIIARENQQAFDALELQTFFEDGDGDSQESNALLQKIGRGIRKMLDRIIMMVENFGRAITNIGKKHMSAEEYMQTNRGSTEYHQRCGKIAKEIDEAFLQMRPIINMISNVTGMDVAKVEKLCDGLNTTIANADWGELAQGVIKRKVAHKKLTDGSYEREIKGYKAKIAKAEAELNDSKRNIKDKKRKLRALNATTSVLGNFCAKIFGSAGNAGKSA